MIKWKQKKIFGLYIRLLHRHTDVFVDSMNDAGLITFEVKYYIISIIIIIYINIISI